MLGSNCRPVALARVPQLTGSRLAALPAPECCLALVGKRLAEKAGTGAARDFLDYGLRFAAV